MSAAKRKPVKTKGAVLIMVLAVMTVMIILLAGSIAVVYTAHTRAQAEYMNSQEYYTTRSILNTFKSSLLSNATDKITGEYIYKIDKATGDQTQSASAEMPVGRALNLDLYKVPVCTDKDHNGTNNTWYYKNVYEPLKNAGIDESKIPDYCNLTAGAIDATELSTCSGYFNQYITKAWSSGMKRGVDDTVTYELDTDQINAMGGNVTKLADDGTAKAVVKIQVLNRKYNLGAGANFTEKFKNGNRLDDEVDIKITVEVTRDGQVSRISDFCSNTSAPPNPSDNGSGANSFGSVGASTTLRIEGGGGSLRKEWNEWKNDATVAGDFFCNGSTHFYEAVFINPRPDRVDNNVGEPNIFFIRHNLLLRNQGIRNEHLAKGSTLYVGNLVPTQNSGPKIGTDAKPINLIAERIQFTHQDMTVYGNIYAEELDLGNNFYPGPSDTNGQKVAQKKGSGGEGANVWVRYLGVPETAIVDDGTNITVDLEKFKNNFQGKLIVTKGIVVLKGDGSTSNVSPKPTMREVSESGSITNPTISEDQPEIKREVYVNNSYPKAANPDFQDQRRYYLGNGDTVSKLDPATGAVEGTRKVVVTPIDTAEVAFKPGDDFSVSYEVCCTTQKKAEDGDTNHFEGYKIRTKGTKIYRQIKLPEKRIECDSPVMSDKLDGMGSDRSQYVELPTIQSVYGKDMHVGVVNSEFGFDGDTFLENGDFNEVFGVTKKALFDSTDSTYHKDNLSNFIKDHTISAECLTNSVLSAAKGNNPYDKSLDRKPENALKTSTSPAPSKSSGTAEVPATATDTVTGEDITIPSDHETIYGDGMLPEGTGDGPGFRQTYYVDARTAPINLYLKSNTLTLDGKKKVNGDFIVYGHNNVHVYIDGLDKDGNLVNGGLFNMGTHGSPFHFMTADILNTDTVVLKDDDDTQSDETLPATPYPNITYWVGRQVKMVFNETGGSDSHGAPATLCGTLYAPNAIYYMATNNNGDQSMKLNYYLSKRNSGNLKGPYAADTTNPYFYGSLICNEYMGGQKAGVVVMRRKGESDDPDSDGLIFRFKSAYNRFD